MALTDAGPEPKPRPTNKLAAIIPYTTIAMVLALLYVAWTFYSRRESAREAQHSMETQQREKQEQISKQIFGSGEVRFTTFSADPGHLKRGDTARLCYGVLNAKTLKLEPAPNEEVKPTARHCVDVSPKVTTTYTLTAANEKGESQSRTLSVVVQ